MAGRPYGELLAFKGGRPNTISALNASALRLLVERNVYPLLAALVTEDAPTKAAVMLPVPISSLRGYFGFPRPTLRMNT